MQVQSLEEVDETEPGLPLQVRCNALLLLCAWCCNAGNAFTMGCAVPCCARILCLSGRHTCFGTAAIAPAAAACLQARKHCLIALSL